jgi:hypothetical protein
VGTVLVTSIAFSHQFIEAGRTLAGALAADEPASGPALRLAMAMHRALSALSPTDLDAVGHTDADTRIHLAAAAALMAIVHPPSEPAAAAAILLWRGPGIGSPHRMVDPAMLVARLLFAFRENEIEEAVRCLDDLFERFPGFPTSGALQDLLVARLQDHGAERERACLLHLEFLYHDDPAIRLLVRSCISAPAHVGRRRTTPARPLWPVTRESTAG